MIHYPTTCQLIELHDYIIDKTGGKSGFINDALETPFIHIQNDSYYPDFFDKITHFFYSITKNHYFNDGNKRAALISYLLFLSVNDMLTIQYSTLADSLENIVVLTADSSYDTATLKEYFKQITLLPLHYKNNDFAMIETQYFIRKHIDVFKRLFDK
jgi:death-on-curing protein